MPDELLDTLAGFPLFAVVPRAQLAWLVAASTRREVAANEFLSAVNEPIEHTYVVLSGKLHLFDPNRPEQDIQLLEAGSVSGYLPFSRVGTVRVRVQASEPAALLVFPKARTQEMAAQCFELTQALVGAMTSRVRELTAQQQQNEKLMALGKLSAGLAHELNNPIGAIASTVEALGRHAQALPAVMAELLPDQAAVLQALKDLFTARPDRPAATSLAQARLEDDLYDWLAAHEVTDAGALAEALAEFSISPADLAAVQNLAPGQPLGPLLRWAQHVQQISQLTAETREAADRVTQLIKSVKIYTHLDQAPVKQPTDLHAGLRNTLTMLGHKIRRGGVQLTEDFDPALPPVALLVGEMNQVWTNLLDNALDALAGVPGAALTITTSRDREFAQVVIADNGPGIPAEVQARIFDPFFTTKPPGQGTGIGLDVVQRIVRQHRGAIKVTSRPGHTAFEVCLPIQ